MSQISDALSAFLGNIAYASAFQSVNIGLIAWPFLVRVCTW